MSQSDRDRIVVDTLEASLVVAAATRGLVMVARAFEHSRLLAPAWRAAAFWQAAGPAPRRFWTGIALVSAAAAHLALAILRPPAPGWLWLIIPLTAATAGLLLIANGRSMRTEPRSISATE